MREMIVVGALVFATVFVYGQIIRHPYIILDYHYYAGNPIVQQGLTWEGVQWAATTEVASNWHPLTLLAHMTIAQVFGLGPAAPHAASVLLHLANVLLVYYLLRSMTGRLWRSAAVAALFALHPLRVESVAWTAELKDVLSTCLALLTILAYLRFVERRNVARFTIVFIVFALGLLSKAMLVTLPFVLLLLDFWPLQRFELSFKGLRSRAFGVALVEKVPLIALSAAMIAVTFVTFRDSTLQSMNMLPRRYFIANSLVAYAKYLWMTLVPVNLAPHYPYTSPETPYLRAGLAAALLVGLTIATFALRRRHPYLLTGWLWFAGTLLPVSGVFPVGSHYMADRYTYLPHIGLLIAVVWLVGDWAANRAWARRTVAAATVAVVLLFSGLSLRQVYLWRSNLALFQHGVAVSPTSALMHSCLATAYRQAGDTAGMEQQLRDAVALDPGNVMYKNRLTELLLDTHRPAEAEPYARQLVEQAPDNPEHYLFMAEARWQQGDRREALGWARKALALDPGYEPARELLARGGDGE